MTSTSTPLRRSTRGFQPLISPQKPTVSKFTDQWLDDGHLFTRPTRPADDLGLNDWELDPDYDWETCHYSGFSRTYPPKPTPKKSGKGKHRAPEAEDMVEDIFEIGDTVLIRGSRKEDSVAIILAAWEVQPVGHELEQEARMDKMLVKVHWFLLPGELSRFGSSRNHQEDEIYYTTSQTDILPLHTLLFHCTITNNLTLSTELSQGYRIASQKQFFCQFAVYKGLFYHFDWEAFRKDALAAYPEPEDSESHPPIDAWVFKIPASGHQKPSTTPASKNRRPNPKLTQREPPQALERESDVEMESVDGSSDEYSHPDGPEESSSEDDAMAEGDESDGKREDSPVDEPGTAKRKRASPKKALKAGGPKRSKPPPSPSKSSAAARKRGKRIRLAKGQDPFGPARATDREVLDKLPRDVHLRAMHLLHVAARPDALPGRENEFDEVLGSILKVLEEGSGGCVYISGVPGTGKTATVHAAVRELQKMALAQETNPFTYVEINGLRLPEPSAAYGVLWEAISGYDSSKEGHLKISPKEALKNLDRYFGGGRIGPSGGAYVVLMDELDQLVTAKQDVVYNFFNWPNLPNSRLIVIAVSNTHDLPERVMSGKVRSRLGMERIHFQPYSRDQLKDIVTSRLLASREGLKGVTENVMHADAVTLAASRIAAVTGDARRVLDICRRTVETVYNPDGGSRIARAPDVSQVIKAMQSSPNAAYLRECSFAERLILAALMKCVKREGVNEVKWMDVTLQCHVLFDQLRDTIMSRPTADQLRMVLRSLVASKAVLLEENERKSVGERLLLMNIETGEVTRALCDVGGKKWQNLLGA